MTDKEIVKYNENELTKMIVNNTPPEIACKILGIDPNEKLYAEIIERSALKAFSDKCAILTKVSEGYSTEITTKIDSDKGGFTLKVEEKVFPPDIKALQLLVDLSNGYSPGRVQTDVEETEQLIVQFVDDLDDDIIEIAVEEPEISNESFL